MLYDHFDHPPAGCGEPSLPPLGKAIPESITLLLARVNNGDRKALDHLVPLVYQELHRIAEGYLRRESQNHTLQPTALIHEAYLRLAEYGGADYQNRKHFFAIAARVMRQILVDHARARQAGKRGAGMTVALGPGSDFAPERDKIVISLDDALNALAAEDDGKARLVEMRFFGGMTAEEIAECVETPVHIVRRELRSAQAWLRREIEA
jgi:RNA polymerase sigma factor (TIGR02999 family)